MARAPLTLRPHGAEHVAALSTWLDDRALLGFAGEAPGGELVCLGIVPHVDRRALDVELGYQREGLSIDVENTASLRLARAASYLREGVLRSLLVNSGVRHDAAVWSRLPGDAA